MNTKKLLDGTAEKVEKMVLVGWRPMIRCGKYVPGIYQNFEVILGGIRQDTGEEMMSESITRVIDGGRTIETMNGTYEIKGPVKQIDRGIEAWISNAFKNGFPDNWHDLFREYVDDCTGQKRGESSSSENRHVNMEQSDEDEEESVEDEEQFVEDEEESVENEIEPTQNSRSTSPDEHLPQFEIAHPLPQLDNAQVAGSSRIQLQKQNVGQKKYNISAEVVGEQEAENDDGTGTPEYYFVELAVKPLVVRMGPEQIRSSYPLLLETYQASKTPNKTKGQNDGRSALPPQKCNAVAVKQLAVEHTNKQQESTTRSRKRGHLDGLHDVNEPEMIAEALHEVPLIAPVAVSTFLSHQRRRKNPVPVKRLLPTNFVEPEASRKNIAEQRKEDSITWSRKRGHLDGSNSNDVNEPEMFVEALHENVPLIAPVAVSTVSLSHQNRRKNPFPHKRILPTNLVEPEASRKNIAEQRKEVTMPRSNKHGYLNDSNDTNDSEMVVEALHENVPLIAPVEPEMVIEALHENVPFIAPVAVPAPSVPHQKRYLLRQNRVLSKRALESSKQKIVNQTKKPMRQAKVERVLDRMNVGTLAKPSWQFLVKWKGYGSNRNSWEPYESIKDLEIVQTFIKRYPRRID